jgi:hypothetical protein
MLVEGNADLRMALLSSSNQEVGFEYTEIKDLIVGKANGK